MKKIISLLLALVMALGLLAGCGDKANTGDNGTGGDTDSAKMCIRDRTAPRRSRR